MRQVTDPPRWLKWAVHCFMLEAFLTTSAGVFSLSPSPQSQHILTVAVWGAIAVLIAAGLALGIQGLSLKLYRRVTFPTLFALLILTTLAVVFDASFFNRLFVASVEETTASDRDGERRDREYDRLVREGAALVAAVNSQLEAARLKAKSGEELARQGIRYETAIRPTERGCGPICERHQRQVQVHQTERQALEALAARLTLPPTAPETREWSNLLDYHAALADFLRTVPSAYTTDLTLPAAPTPESTLTKSGMAQGIGGLGAMTELILAGELTHPKVALPLGLGAFCQYAVVILMLGTRPWRSVSVWARERLEHLEAAVETTPALLPLLWRMTKRVVKDDPKAWEERSQCYRRKRNLEEVRYGIDELTAQESQLQQRYAELLRRSTVSNGAGNHRATTGNTNHGGA